MSHKNLSDLQPWKTLKTKDVYVGEPWIKLSVEQILLPDGRVIDDYYQVQFIHCVVIYAETMDGKVIMERQYKHGVKKITWTLPTGGIGKGEDPLLAAQREFQEETGYVADKWEAMGHFTQMGNQGGGIVNLYRAYNARRVSDPVPSDLEEMDIVLMTRSELMEAIQKGDICILSTVTAISMATNPEFTK